MRCLVSDAKNRKDQYQTLVTRVTFKALDNKFVRCRRPPFVYCFCNTL